MSEKRSSLHKDPKAESEPPEPQGFGRLHTFQMISENDPKRRIRSQFIELLTYIIFLIMVLIVSCGMITASFYYLTMVMAQQFLDSPFNNVNETKQTSFRTSYRVLDFWGFAENVIPVVFNEKLWNEWKSENPDDAGHSVLSENKILGLPQLRQVRVKKNTCVVHENFRRMFNTCYALYSVKIEDKAPFGPQNTKAWTYTSEENLGGMRYTGIFSTYGSGGYYETIQMEPNKTLEIIGELKENLWIDRGTRAIFLDFTVYNGNVNLFCIVKLIWEFPPTGGVVPSHSFTTAKLIRYFDSYDYFILGCEFVVIIFIVYYTFEEIFELIVLKRRYFKLYWNYFDLVHLIVAYIWITVSVIKYFKSKEIPDLVKKKHDHLNFEAFAYLEIVYINVLSVFVFLTCIKIIKYISFSRTLMQLSHTLSRCFREILGFTIMFFIVFFAYAQMGYLMFGSEVEEFSGFGTSIFTLFLTILGDFNYEKVRETNKYLAPLFFITYIFFVFFILLNIFLAIINDTYSQVRSEISVQPDKQSTFDYIGSLFSKLKGLCFGKSKPGKNDANEGKLTYNDIKQTLKRANFTDLEIEMFFAKYDIQGEQVVTEEDTMKMLADLEMGRYGSGDTEQDMSAIAIEELRQRVDEIEQSINKFTAKVETILDRIYLIRANR